MSDTNIVLKIHHLAGSSDKGHDAGIAGSKRHILLVI